MSTLTLLPLVRVTDGVQLDEDWLLTIAYYLDDDVTPINLDGLTFNLTVGALATLSSASGQIYVSGASSNLLVIAVPAAAKASWSAGVYPIALSATDGVSARDLFALSTLTVGAPQVARVSLIVAPDTLPTSVASPIPAALGQALQALQPGAIAVSLADLPNAQLLALMQALVSALPVQTSSQAPVATGQAFVNTSGYLVIAQ